MAEGDTWESKENLENAQELVEEFEEEYGKDNGEVRRQEKVESNHDYWREGFPGRYAARKLFGWSDKRYDREYWEKLEKRWRRWKGLQPLKQRNLETIREEQKEEEEKYQGGRIEEWNEEDEMGCMGDAMGEL